MNFVTQKNTYHSDWPHKDRKELEGKRVLEEWDKKPIGDRPASATTYTHPCGDGHVIASYKSYGGGWLESLFDITCQNVMDGSVEVQRLTSIGKGASERTDPGKSSHYDFDFTCGRSTGLPIGAYVTGDGIGDSDSNGPIWGMEPICKDTITSKWISGDCLGRGSLYNQGHHDTDKCVRESDGIDQVKVHWQYKAEPKENRVAAKCSGNKVITGFQGYLEGNSTIRALQPICTDMDPYLKLSEIHGEPNLEKRTYQLRCVAGNISSDSPELLKACSVYKKTDMKNLRSDLPALCSKERMSNNSRWGELCMRACRYLDDTNAGRGESNCERIFKDGGDLSIKVTNVTDFSENDLKDPPVTGNSDEKSSKITVPNWLWWVIGVLIIVIIGLLLRWVSSSPPKSKN